MKCVCCALHESRFLGQLFEFFEASAEASIVVFLLRMICLLATMVNKFLGSLWVASSKSCDRVSKPVSVKAHTSIFQTLRVYTWLLWSICTRLRHTKYIYFNSVCSTQLNSADFAHVIMSQTSWLITCAGSWRFNATAVPDSLCFLDI